MTVVFRVDASARIGTGHVMRCLALAEELRTRGVQSRFVCRESPGHLFATLRERSFLVTPLPDSDPATAGQQGPQMEDAEQTCEALRGIDHEWVVVDHYGLDAEWERRLRRQSCRLLVIDDLANRPHDCDLLLDQNYSPEAGRSHASLVPASCTLLVGPRYALLAAEYASFREAHPRRGRAVGRVLIYFGGVDPSNMTGEALTALSAPEFSHLQIDLVIGTNHSQRSALEAQAAGRRRTCVSGTRRHLADLMAAADVAVGAGGITTWERMCLGLPAVVVSIAENQRPTNEALAADGLIAYVGDHRSVGASQIHDTFAQLVANPDRLTMLSVRGQQLVDGRGASRVADVMLAPDREQLMRKRNALHEAGACPDGFDRFTWAWIDRCRADEVLALRNMPHVREQMRSQDPIGPHDHRRFLEHYGGLDRYDFVLIDTTRHRYVGAFYVTNIRSVSAIGKYIGDPAYIGKGIAHRAMERMLDYCRSEAGLRRLVSTTRHDNAANIALNAKLGFRPSGTTGEFVEMTLDL